MFGTCTTTCPSFCGGHNPDCKYEVKSTAADYYVVKSSDLKDLKLKIKMGIEGDQKLFPLAAWEPIEEMNSPRTKLRGITPA
jgi:hypothetical protein